jgi:hypothetical protein
MRRVIVSVAVGLGLLGAGCGSGVDLTGRWAGHTVDNAGGVGTLSWNVTQSGDTFAGTMRLADSFDGTVTGTISGNRITYAMAVTVAPCTLSATGTGTASDTEIKGDYTAATNRGCPLGTVSAGQMLLTRP